MTGTERKVFQKYYPPDFDPSKIPRGKGQRNRQFIQRVMAPYNMRCDTCHEYIYKGKKFNMRRETAEGEFYLGLKIFRFYFRCPNCLAEITFKTDLENCDYQQEHGATRLFEAFKLYQQEEKAKETQEEEDKKDPMKMLEKRTKMSRAEMEEMRKLEEIQEVKRQQEAMGSDEYLRLQGEARAKALRDQEERDEEFVKSLYGRTEDGQVIRRIVEDDDDEELAFFRPSEVKAELKEEPKEEDAGPCCSKLLSETSRKTLDPPEVPNKRLLNSQKELLSRIVVAKRKKTEEAPQSIVKTDVETQSNEATRYKQDSVPVSQKPVQANALSSLCGYGSDSSSE